MSANPQPVSIAVDDKQRVSGLLQVPRVPRACYVMAHGAGAGMAHPFMAAIAPISPTAASPRFAISFRIWSEARGDRTAAVAHAAVRAAVAEASRLVPELALFAGGKSFGGRMTSQAQAIAPLSGVRGLAFVGFPLHPAGKPSDERGAHLFDVKTPMLFMQGTRDKLADVRLLRALVGRLGARPRYGRSRTPTIRFTSPRARDARIRTSEPTWRMRWPTGSIRRFRAQVGADLRHATG